MSFDLFPWVALIIIILALIAAVIVFAQWIYPRLSVAQQMQIKHDIVVTLANTVVPAIEQVSGNLAGVDKKAMAVQQITTALVRMGIVGIPSFLIDAAIEAAVYAMNKGLPALQAWIAAQQAVPAASLQGK